MESCLHLILTGRIRIDRRINGTPCIAAKQRISIAGTHGLGRLLLELEKISRVCYYLIIPYTKYKIYKFQYKYSII